jgi:hypothetical protein
MITGETHAIEVRVLDDGLVQARRKDRREMTPSDWREAYRLAGVQPREQPSSRPGDPRRYHTVGITVADVLAVFPGARIVAENKPRFCAYCSKDGVPAWRRGGKIVQVTEVDAAPAWACHYCGRRNSEQNQPNIPNLRR